MFPQLLTDTTIFKNTFDCWLFQKNFCKYHVPLHSHSSISVLLYGWELTISNTCSWSWCTKVFAPIAVLKQHVFKNTHDPITSLLLNPVVNSHLTWPIVAFITDNHTLWSWNIFSLWLSGHYTLVCFLFAPLLACSLFWFSLINLTCKS